MLFNFISEAEAIAKHNMPWVIGLVLIGIALVAYYFSKDKSLPYLIAGCLMVFSGTWLGYKTHLLNQSKGIWQITLNSEQLDWRSPDETVDKSFTIQLSEIETLVVDIYDGQPDATTQYTLITSGNPIKLSRTSGINLEKLAQQLISAGVTSKEIIHETAKK